MAVLSLSYCRITYYHSLLLQPLLGKYENFFLFFLGSCNGFSPQFRLLPLQQREATTTTDHSTPFGTESKSQGSWKADLSITLGILFVYWFCFSIWKQAGSQVVAWFWMLFSMHASCKANVTFFMRQIKAFSCMFTAFFNILTFCFNKQFKMIFYLLCKSQIMACKNRETLFP